MKKGFFAIMTVFSLLVIAASVFADSEYDAGVKNYYRGHYRNAIVRLKASVEKRPDPAAYYLIGYSLYKLGRFSEATEYFNEAYLIDPNFSPKKYGLGREMPKVKARPRGTRKKASGHASSARMQKKAPAGKKPTQGKKAAHEKSPAPPQKSATRKNP